MLKTPLNHNKLWTKAEIGELRKLAKTTPTELIAKELKRTPVAVQAKANEEGISLKPVNRPPYNRKK